MHALASTHAIRRLVASALLVLLLTSCGPQVIEGRPPFISIAAMALKADQLSAEFDIRNENEVPMNISAVQITVTVENNAIVTHRDKLSLEIGASSSERVHVDQMPKAFTRSLLESLQSGENKSLAFDVAGTVQTLEDGSLDFAHKGYLYPMPGRPGEFRAAVTQAEGLTREKFN